MIDGEYKTALLRSAHRELDEAREEISRLTKALDLSKLQSQLLYESGEYAERERDAALAEIVRLKAALAGVIEAWNHGDGGASGTEEMACAIDAAQVAHHGGPPLFVAGCE